MGTNDVITSAPYSPEFGYKLGSPGDTAPGGGGTGQNPGGGDGTPGGGNPGGGTPGGGGGTPGGGTPGGGTPGGGTPGGGTPGGGTPPTAGQTGDGVTVLGNTGSGHLIDLELGPAGQGGLPINILADPDGSPSHTIDLNVLDIGPDAPSLIDGTLLSGVGGGAGDILTNPLEIVDGVLGDGLAGGLGNDGLNVLGDSDSGHLVDVELGPAGQSILPVNILANPDAASDHAIDLNVLDIGPNGPSLLDTTLLSGVGSSDGAPALSGLDSLVGNVFDTLDTGSIVDDCVGNIISAPVGIVEDVLDPVGGHLLGGVLDHGLLPLCEAA